jgi:hypothetical protein
VTDHRRHDNSGDAARSYRWLCHGQSANYSLSLFEQDEEALRWMRRAAAASPETPTILAALTSELALTGHDAEASTTLARYLSLKRTSSRTIAQWNHLPDANPAFVQFDARFKSGLRRAGMPEQ